MRRLPAAVVLSWLGLAICATCAHSQTALDRLEAQVRGAIGQVGGDEPGYLGVVLDDSPSGDVGVVVRDVRAGGPAASAGLQTGDVVTAIDGKPVRTFSEFAAAMRPRAPGAKVDLTLVRSGENVEATVTLGRRPAAASNLPSPGQQPAGPPDQPSPPGQPVVPDRIGLVTVPVTPDVQLVLRLPEARGALVAHVLSGSPAQEANIPRDAVLLAVDGKKIDTPTDWRRMLDEAGGATIKVALFHRGQLMERKIDLAKTAPTAPGGFPAAGEPLGALPPPSDAARIEQLERRVAELERRLAATEQQLRKALETGRK